MAKATTKVNPDKAFLETIREAFEADQGHDCRLTDDAIMAIVNKIGREEFVEMDGDEQMGLLVKAEEAFKGIAVADPSITGIVAKFDDEFDKELTVCLEAFVKAKTSTLDMFGQFKRLFTREQLNEMPYPGSDKDSVAGTNYKPDIVERPNKLAGGTIRTVFTDDLVYATARGKAAQSDIDDATKELKAQGSVARFKGLGKQVLRDKLKTATQTRNNMRKMFRTALQLHHKLDAIEAMPLVAYSWIKGTDEKCPLIPKDYKGKELIKVTRGPSPIWLKNKDDDASGAEFSAAQIIAMDPSWALKQPDGGTKGDLIDSAKPEPETPDQLGEKMSEETMDTTIVVINAKLSNTIARAALRKRAMEPDNDEMRASYCALFQNLQGYYAANEKWYAEYLEKLDEQSIKERDEKLAAAKVA